MDTTGAGREPGLPVRVPALRQRWEQVAFLHWRVDAADLRPLVHDRHRVEEVDGSAWASLVLFCASRTRAGFPSPHLPPFAETNLRTYVTDEHGRRAIWFLDLEATSAVVAAGGRLGTGVPYHRAQGAVTVTPEEIRYVLARRRGGPGHDIRVAPGDLLDEGERTPRDDWLTGRWRAFSRRAGLDLEVHVRHPPWPLRRGEVTHLEEDLFAACGIAHRASPDVVHVAGAVDVALSPPFPLRRP